MSVSSDASRPLRIAIVRFTSLGDVIHALPMAAAIRQHLPAARISWLVEEREQIIVRDNAVVDDVILVPLRRWRSQLTSAAGWRQAWTELRTLSRALRAAAFDVAIDVQGWAHKTSPFTLLTRAPLRIGFDRAHARDALSPLATNRHVTPPAAAVHIVDQNLSLLEPLGIRFGSTVAQFPLPAFCDAESRAARWRDERRLPAFKQIVVLLPSTRGAAKRWAADRYRSLATRFLADPATCLLVVGGPGEDAILESVVAGLPADRAFVYAPEPIPDVVAMLRHVHVTVGNDTGPLHIAAGSGVPSLGLFGPTRGARNGPYGSHCAFLQSPTGRMDDLSVDDVWAAVEQLRRAT